MITREEWDALSDTEKWRYVELTDAYSDEMHAVLSEIPECPHHGFCLPYFRKWILQTQGKIIDTGAPNLLEFEARIRELLKP